MVIRSYTNGKKTYSHKVGIGDNEVVLYFGVKMPEEDIKEFANTLGIKGKVKEFYACVVVNNLSTPRTFIAYKTVDDVIVELFGISTGIKAVTILKDGFMAGGNNETNISDNV